jgi:CHAT domain-containing protein
MRPQGGNKSMNRFTEIRIELLDYVGKWEPKLAGLPEILISRRRNRQNRTIRQITGHMADSASNNTHRVIHLQYDESPCHFPDYANLGNNDRWIAIQNYQAEDWEDLVQYWKTTHRHFAHIIANIQPDKLENRWISALDQEITLNEMVIDFNRHFKLHLNEIDAIISGE